MEIDAQWIEAAYRVLHSQGHAMLVSEIERLILAEKLVQTLPSMSLEVLMTKEAAMGRRFVKTSTIGGTFNLLGAEAPFLSSLANGGALSGSLTSSSLSHVAVAGGAKQATTSILLEQHKLQQQPQYKEKYRRMKRLCKRLLFENAALADEVALTDENVATAAADRRSLLKRLMVHEGIPEPEEPPPDAVPLMIAEDANEKKRTPSSKKKAPAHTAAAITAGTSKPSHALSTSIQLASDLASEAARAASLAQQPTKKAGSKKVVVRIPPIELDAVGRPMFPINLDAGLTIYSIGEITDKPGYHCAKAIYPVGYCCTRAYASLSDPTEACLYTCKVMELDSGPKFELSPENNPSQVFVGGTPEDCHKKLMKVVSYIVGCEIKVIEESDFFGLCHPVVRNLLQCCPGAKKCKGYQWTKFEVCRDEEKVSAASSQLDPATSHEILCSVLRKGKIR